MYDISYQKKPKKVNKNVEKKQKIVDSFLKFFVSVMYKAKSIDIFFKLLYNC